MFTRREYNHNYCTCTRTCTRRSKDTNNEICEICQTATLGQLCQNSSTPPTSLSSLESICLPHSAFIWKQPQIGTSTGANYNPNRKCDCHIAMETILIEKLSPEIIISVESDNIADWGVYLMHSSTSTSTHVPVQPPSPPQPPLLHPLPHPSLRKQTTTWHAYTLQNTPPPGMRALRV